MGQPAAISKEVADLTRCVSVCVCVRSGARVCMVNGRVGAYAVHSSAVGSTAPHSPKTSRLHHVREKPSLTTSDYSDYRLQPGGGGKRVFQTGINQPFIVLTETKFSYRYIPVWARYSPHRTRVEAHANMLSP